MQVPKIVKPRFVPNESRLWWEKERVQLHAGERTGRRALVGIRHPTEALPGSRLAIQDGFHLVNEENATAWFGTPADFFVVGTFHVRVSVRPSKTADPRQLEGFEKKNDGTGLH